MFNKLLEISPVVWVTLAAIVVVAAVFFIISRDKRRWSANMLATAAACLALSFVLSYIRLYKMPQGGSITPASMLPVMAFSYIFGVIPGLLAGLAYGLLQMIQDPFIIHPVQLMLDYIIPFCALALCGSLRNISAIPRAARLPIGVALAALVRVVVHVVSGVVFFAEYAGDMNPIIYSLGYNLSSVGVDGLICVVIALIPPVGHFIDTMRAKQTTIRSGRGTSHTS